MNTLEGEIAVLEHAFDRVSKGGIVVLDDYEWAGSYRNQKIGEDRWFDARGYRIFPLPTGQGLVLKR
jgi:predicted O-methyltransferase YrrM